MGVRVRGIYATALTKILLDSGFKLSHTSKVIEERFGVVGEGPPKVTVKDADQRHGVVVVGDYEIAKKVFETLSNFAIARWVSKLPLHAVVKGRVEEVRNGTAIVDLGGYEGLLEGNFSVGDEVLVDIARPFMPSDEYARLSTNYTIFGDYVALIRGIKRRVVFSRHITDRRLRDDLAALSAMCDVGEWCVKWRSSATLGKLEDMLRDIRKTYELAKEVMKRGEEAEVGEIVYSGEFFGVISFGEKEKLDDLRNEVTPTIRHHHSLKSVGEGEIVDFGEHTLRFGADRDAISRAAIDFVMSNMGIVEIEHVSLLRGQTLKLTPGKAVSRGCLKRVFRKPGFFDGLGVRKEPGDYDMMEFSPELPFILHRYYSRDGELKGIYVNLNTLPDVGRKLIRYLDMEIDVVARGGETKVLDSEKLQRACELGIVKEDVKNYYEELAEKIRRVIEGEREVTIEQLAEVL
ncbi:MAG: DUF402 domain-containing protein [Archaeoglobaceae archaeon]